jgi:hypothetical protein
MPNPLPGSYLLIVSSTPSHLRATLAVAGLLACLIAGCTGSREATYPTAGLSVQPSSGVSFQTLSSCGGAMPGLSIKPLPTGTRPTHSWRQALAKAPAYEAGHVTDVVAAYVADPIGVKLNLPTTPRVMWLIYVKTVYGAPDPTRDYHGIPPPTPGTVERTVWLIDDKTLKPGGGLGCES